MKNQTFLRIFLLLFVIAIFAWLIPSTIGFINLNESRAHELPQWLQDASVIERASFILIAVQLPYFLIAIGLFTEFLKPNIKWQYNKNKFLSTLSIILIILTKT